MNSNTTLPPGSTINDVDPPDDGAVECDQCCNLFVALPHETACHHCQAQEDKGDDA